MSLTGRRLFCRAAPPSKTIDLPGAVVAAPAGGSGGPAAVPAAPCPLPAAEPGPDRKAPGKEAPQVPQAPDTPTHRSERFRPRPDRTAPPRRAHGAMARLPGGVLHFHLHLCGDVHHLVRFHSVGVVAELVVGGPCVVRTELPSPVVPLRDA